MSDEEDTKTKEETQKEEPIFHKRKIRNRRGMKNMRKTGGTDIEQEKNEKEEVSGPIIADETDEPVDSEVERVTDGGVDKPEPDEGDKHDHVHGPSCSHGHDHGDPKSKEEKEIPTAEEHSAVKKRKRPKIQLMGKEKETALMYTTRRLRTKKVDEAIFKSTRNPLPSVAANEGVSVEVSTLPRKNPEKPKWFGPMKQNDNVRTISRFDYQPDLCKDYKETGYCGYGDACKFLHDRGDYKTGWQLEKEWEIEQDQKRKKALGQEVDEEVNYEVDDPDSDLPWACLMCKGDFVNPVVTKCGHHFCEKCALEYYVKDSRCHSCRAQTNGIFNTATRLLASLDKKKRRMAEEEERNRELGKEKKKIKENPDGWAIPG